VIKRVLDVILGMMLVVLLWTLIVTFGEKLREKAKQSEWDTVRCAVVCESTSVVILDGKCGCVTWKEMPK
jgi:hypothetical protein